MVQSEGWQKTIIADPRVNKALRYALMLFASYLIALSIAMARTAGLGTSPISSMANVLSLIFIPITIGTLQFFYNALMVVGQIVLNKSWRKPVEWFQMIMVFFFAAFVDLNVYLLQGLYIPDYLWQWIWTALSIVLLGLGVALELRANVVIMPGEGIVVSIAQVTGVPFSKCKVAFDVANVLAAAVISLVAFSALVGVREGTIATALFTGVAVSVFKWILGPRQKKSQKKQS